MEQRPSGVRAPDIETIDDRRLFGSANDESAITLPCRVMLEVALATELISVLRCRRFHFCIREASERPIAIAFLVHSVLAQRNADGLAGRIVELGGCPSFSPDGLGQGLAPYTEPSGIHGLIDAAISAERSAMRYYHRYLAQPDRDLKTSRLLQSIVAAGAKFINDLETGLP